MSLKRVTWCVVLAAALGVLAGVAWAQDLGHGGGRQGAPCVGSARVVPATRSLPPAAMRACTASADCVLAQVGCCPACGAQGPSSLRAVNAASRDAWRRRTCTTRSPACPACVTRPAPRTLHAECVAQVCELTRDDASCRAAAASPYGRGGS